jgi:hypothetical protein
MNNRWWNDDDELLAALANALEEVHAVPDRFVENGKAAYAWLNIDAELATVTYDSVLDNRQPVEATRSKRAALRELTFATDQLKIHLQVTDQALFGQIVPPQRGEIELRTQDGEPVATATDDDGWFSIQPIPTGRFRLHCRTASGLTALTDWLTV